MKRIRAVLTDLDGTLLLPDVTFTDNVKRAVASLQQAGIPVSAVTGRSFRDIGMTCQRLGLAGPAAFSGGAVIFDVVSGDVLWEKRIADATLKQIVTALYPFAQYVSYGQGRLPMEYVDLSKLPDSCLSVWVEVPEGLLAKSLAVLRTIEMISYYSNACSVAGLIGIQITNAEADKSHGTRRLLELLGVPPSDALAIGDDHNDLPMFTVVGTSVVMGNAPQNLKKRAHQVVGTIFEDGFVEAIDKYVLGKL